MKKSFLVLFERVKKTRESISIGDASTYGNFTKIFGKFTDLLMLMTVMV